MKTPLTEFIFIIRQDHCDQFQLDKVLLDIEPNAKIVKINELTEGSICTVLLAKDHFNNEHPVIIKDCDQIINWDPHHFLEYVDRNEVDGAVVTIHTDRPNYSFSKLDSDGKVIETAEKSVISNYGHTGIYYFSKGSDLIKYSQRMIDKNIRVHNEFYTAPVYNQFIQDFKTIVHYPVAEMFQLGTPEEFAINQNKVIRYFNSWKKKKAIKNNIMPQPEDKSTESSHSSDYLSFSDSTNNNVKNDHSDEDNDRDSFSPSNHALHY